MKLPLTRSILVVLLGALLASSGYGQSTGLFAGGRSVGGGTISGGSRNAFGGGGAGGGLGVGGGGAPGSTIDSALGSAGQITGSERFVRDNRTAAAFVGADVADTAFIGALEAGAAGAGFANSFGAGGGFGTAGARGGQMGRNATNRGAGGGNVNQNRQVNVRTTLKLGFRPPAFDGASVSTSLQSRLNRVRIQRVTPLRVQTQGRNVILQGTVASESARTMALAIASLEPGVETVVDQLSVAGGDSQQP